MTPEPGSVKAENIGMGKQDLTTGKSKENGVDFGDDDSDIGDYEFDNSYDDILGVDVSNMSQTCKDCLLNQVQQKEYHLMPAHRCDRWDLESRTCWLDRNIGSTVTFSLTFKNSMEEVTRFPDVVWQQEFHILHKKDRIFFVIKNEKSLWNIVISSRGHEFRLSPISEMDIEPNRFSAVLSSSPAPLNKVHFKIRLIPIDIGFVYLGETLVLNMDSFISLPLESMAYVWYMEMGGETGNLPSNMRTSPSGSVLTISELRKEQEGILSCSVFSNLGFLIARKRFHIKNISSGGKRVNTKNKLKESEINHHTITGTSEEYFQFSQNEKPEVDKQLDNIDRPQGIPQFKFDEKDKRDHHENLDTPSEDFWEDESLLANPKVNENDGYYSYDQPEVVETFTVNNEDKYYDYDLPRYETVKVKSALNHNHYKNKRRDFLAKNKIGLKRASRTLKYRNGGRYPKIPGFRNGHGEIFRRPIVSMAEPQQQEINRRKLKNNSPELQRQLPFLLKNNAKFFNRTHEQQASPLVEKAGSSQVNLRQNVGTSFQNEQRNLRPVENYFKPVFPNIFSNQPRAPHFPTGEDQNFPDQYFKENTPLAKIRNLQNRNQLKQIDTIDLSHPDDQISMLIAECHKNTQCSLHAVCVVRHNYDRKSGFCRCSPNFRGNGISCWEFSLEIAPSFSD